MATVYSYEPAPGHANRDHPEHPSRLSALATLLGEIKAKRLEPRMATLEEIRRVHTPELIESLEETCRQGDAIIDFAPTFVTRSSFDDARAAAGATIACTEFVMQGKAENAFAIVRPPGHHAEPWRAMGFCLFNNVAIAAAAALKAGAARVAIVDYDAHHGNGTQAAFREQARAAYLSTHQWGIYPGSGRIDELPAARSRIVNVPLPAYAGDATFRRILAEIVDPFLRKFAPDLILVSAGFDAHWNDPLTALGLSYSGFHSLAHGLVALAEDLCGGRIVFALEGGYDPQNVANGCMGLFAALQHEPYRSPDPASPHKEQDSEKLIEAVRRFHGFSTGAG